MNNARSNGGHVTFSDAIGIVANRMIAADDQRYGRTRNFTYIGASGAIHTKRGLLASEVHALCIRFAENGKIAGVDFHGHSDRA